MPSDPLLAKAERYIRSARLLAQHGDLDSAASRLYYAMYYIAEALLAARGLSFSSHSAVISAYGQHFARTRAMDPRFHRALLTAFSQRQLGDYAVDSGLSGEDIDALLGDAEDFLSAAGGWLEAQYQDGETPE
jgi:uncharacterized protein (UPF0332 family)